MFPKFTAVSGNRVYRVVLSLRRIPKRLLLKFLTRTKRRNEERVDKSQTKIQPCMNCIVIIISWLVKMTVSLADVLRGGECWNKAEDHAKGPIYAASFLLHCLPLSDILSLISDYWVKANHRE